ncbi:MAG: hypothetical protein ACRDF6_12085 [bacterium]
MGTDSVDRLSAEWPDWIIGLSRQGRYWIATYRRRIPIKALLGSTRTPDATVIADSPQELAELLRKQPRGTRS